MSNEAKRKTEAAPDREKFLAFADAMSNMLALVPDACTAQGATLEGHVCIIIKEFAAWVERKAGEL